jgi:hypothetical protein
MATRMQQRRGTAAQWTGANPILAAGEIGFETDTGKFKMGNGSSAWSALSYFADASDFDTTAIEATIDSKVGTAVNNLVAGAPAALNTLNELATAINGDSTFAATITSALASKATLTQVNAHEALTTNVHGIADTSLLSTTEFVAARIGDNTVDGTAGNTITARIATAQTAAENTASTNLTLHIADTENIHGIADTTALATKTYADNAVSVHSNDTTGIHGIADTENLATKPYADAAVTSHNSTSLSVHGIADTSVLATMEYANNAVGTHNSDTTGVHGITDTTALATKTYADTAVSTHNGLTENIHGITDTAALATKAGAETLTNKTISLGSNTVSGTKAEFDAAMSDADFATLAGTETLTNKTLTSPAITSPSGLVKADVGLDDVDNTSDADKPISTATQAALDLKAPLASPALTGTPTAPTATAGTNTTQVATTAFVTGAVADLVASAPSALNTLNELAAALGNDANYATTITNALAAKAPIASPTFTGTVTVAASGIAFTDGTQTKEGVPSRTAIIQKSAAYTLSALTERDSMIEVSHTGGSAVDITIPANSSVAYPVGTSIDVLRTNTGGVRIVGASGVTVNATPGAFLRAQWSAATLFKRGTDSWVLIGDLATA